MLKRWQQTFAAVLESSFARIVFAVFAVVAAWDTFGSQLMPPGVRENWPTAYDVAGKTTGFFPLWVWIAVGASILIAFTFEYAHRKRGGNTFYSPTVTRFPLTLEQLRALPSAPLREARRAGVVIRNETLTSETQFPEWMERYGAWREQTLKTSAEISPVLHDLLESLNEVHGYPSGLAPINGQHALRLAIISEILRRIDRYLAEHQQ